MNVITDGKVQRVLPMKGIVMKRMKSQDVRVNAGEPVLRIPSIQQSRAVGRTPVAR